MATTPACYSADAILKDGTPIRIRALQRGDRQRLISLFDRLSQRSVYFRFFRPKKWLTEGELMEFTELDFESRVALAATQGLGNEERILGVGRYNRVEDGPSHPQRAEAAFAVSDEDQGRGIGTLLLEHLVGIARSQGIVEIQADVLEENRRMIEMFGNSGFQMRRRAESGVVHIILSTEETKAFLAAHDQRERQAASRSGRARMK